MCLIALAWRAHPEFELVVAANRDEFHDRPAAAAAQWTDAPGVFGGRDLSHHGSWLAVAHGPRLACVTNVRRMVPPNPVAPSRGKLVASFVQGRQSARAFADQMAAQAEDFAGFNLLVHDGRDLWFMTNQPAARHVAVEPGVHVLSNASLDTPWPKAQRLRGALEDWIATSSAGTGGLFDALADREPARDDELPDTGIGRETERLLSAPFIVSPRYGTRASTVVATRADGATLFEERRFDAQGQRVGHTRERLALR